MTVRKCISRTRRHFEVFDDINALEYMQEVHNHILSLCRVKPDENVDINLVQGQFTYALDPLVMKVWDARYINSATTGDSRRLEPRAVDELDFQTRGQWRYNPAGTPIWYDERSGQLVVIPAPDTATSAGYPIVRLVVQKSDTLTLDSVLPTAVHEYDAWVFGLGLKYAKEKGNVRVMARITKGTPLTFSPAQTFEYLYTQAINNLIAFTEGKSARERPNIQANVPRPQIV